MYKSAEKYFYLFLPTLIYKNHIPYTLFFIHIHVCRLMHGANAFANERQSPKVHAE